MIEPAPALRELILEEACLRPAILVAADGEPLLDGTGNPLLDGNNNVIDGER